MAKKRNTGSEPAVSGTGASAARERRYTSKHSAVQPAEPLSPGISAPAENESTTSVEAAAMAVATAEYTPESEEIARLAYSYWEARGRQGGSPEEDWLRAEQELRSRRGLTHTAA